MAVGRDRGLRDAPDGLEIGDGEGALGRGLRGGGDGEGQGGENDCAAIQ
jgi:hypothetical protein